MPNPTKQPPSLTTLFDSQYYSGLIYSTFIILVYDFKNRKMKCLIHSFSFPLYQHRVAAAFAC